MSEDFVWRVFDKHMNQLIRLFKKCPPEQRRVIPDGFHNNVHWHLGHVLYITQHEVLGLSERPLVLPESYEDFFAFGTKPADWKEDPPEWDLLIAQLKELRHYIHESLEHRLTEPVGENFLRARDISELVSLTSLHLSYHQGVVYGMLKSMNMNTNEEEQVTPSTGSFLEER
ncbi:DinB family protein [Paenibacillus taihuensis]|uniref:DinB family protein n=1 Tax=Paenibacillus taihuensis TaxID=1156355 RepID=A0A3D9QWX4_9BACL|nr:DinB family protein [Paenibacillus taihuensis]REE69724.1 DinB family protein [Paenibacillus taihuensis]